MQVFQNMARRMRLAAEAHLGIRIPHKHPVLMWLIEWLGGAHNRFKEGRDDGRTPRERAGWQSQSTVWEFGETVHFVPFQAEARADKFDAKLRTGVWMGLDNRTDESLVGTKYGVYRTATVKSLPEDQRWNPHNVLAVVGLPWDPTPNVEAEDGARVPNPVVIDAEAVPQDPEVPADVARRMYIYKRDIDDPAIGPTPGCIGCHNLRLGKSAQSHTQECRDRIEGLLRETDQGRERLRRAEERISTAVARESERLARGVRRDAAEEASVQAQPPSEVRESAVGSAPGADEDSQPPSSWGDLWGVPPIHIPILT